MRNLLWAVLLMSSAALQADDQQIVEQLKNLLEEQATPTAQLLYPDVLTTVTKKPKWTYELHRRSKAKAGDLIVKFQLVLVRKDTPNMKEVADFYVHVDGTPPNVTRIVQSTLTAKPKAFSDAEGSLSVFTDLGSKYRTLKISAGYKEALRTKEPTLMAIAFLNDRWLNAGKTTGVYDALRLPDRLTSPGVLKVGDDVKLAYTITNSANKAFVLGTDHLLKTKGTIDRYRVGTIQKWVERLGPNKVINAIPATTTKQNDWYAVGGYAIILPNSTVPADFSRSPTTTIKTVDWPTGSYMLKLEFRDINGNVVDTATTTFRLTAK